MEMEQMMEHLLAEIRTNQIKMGPLASWKDVNQERLDTNLKEMKEETKAKLDSNQEVRPFEERQSAIKQK
jgi:hypothetical protein